MSKPGTVIPYLCCKDAARALEFYAKAFGAVVTLKILNAGSDVVGHADLEIEGGAISLSDEWPEGGIYSPTTLGGSSTAVHLYVANVDAFFARAVAAGATSEREPADQPYGDRGGTLRDPFGHRWFIAQHLESVSKDEMRKRFGDSFLVD